MAAETENKNAEQRPTEKKQMDYVRMTIPKGFAHPYTFTDQKGKEWDKAVINIPKGAKANGIDLSGYSMDCFLNSRQVSQIANGKPLSVSMRAGEPIELFKGKGENRKTFDIDPWALTSAVKDARESYAVDKAAERVAEEDISQDQKQPDAAKEESGADLGTEAKDMSGAKEALSGHGAPEQSMQER